MTPHYPQGAYRCEIVDQGLSMSKNNNPQIWLRILVKESLEMPQGPVEEQERTVYWTITDKTIDFVMEKLEALGFTGQSFKQLDMSSSNPESFVGQTEDFYCKWESYEGQERERWDLSRGATEVKPLDDSETRKLDAMFGRKLKDRFGGKLNSTPKVQPSEPVPSIADEDSIPF